MKDWFDEDAFWLEMEPVMFSENRWAEAAHDVAAIVALAGLDSAAGPVLDMPCGPGRHLQALAGAGFSATGVDRTARYLETARGRTDAELVQGDMRDFVRAGAFQAVLNLYSSFGYFDDIADDRKVLDNILSSLLHRVGFSQVDVYGSVEGAPYDHQAGRLVVVAHKPSGSPPSETR